jgi:hypothetical protein
MNRKARHRESPGQWSGHVTVKVAPFSRVVGLNYDDGPTSGVAESVDHTSCYRFELLDELPDWDEGNDIRVFSLAALPPGSFDSLLHVCPGSGPATSPVWVPIWKFDSPAAQETAEQAVQRILDRAAPPEAVIATDASLSTVIARRPVTDDDLRQVKDWFGFLGLARPKSADHV